ncbi:MAG: alpha-ketoacid dehydrogenase subunit beta [Porticoccaceae bacterium]|nr:alpha-ketoacid dehydrogenase subunit beta [Porticoccaceae bacterium]
MSNDQATSTADVPASAFDDLTQSASSRVMTCARAQREALEWEMTHDKSVFMLGEDVYGMGGVFGTADGLGAKFGKERILDTPISETGFIGMAAGAAIAGMRPVIELAYVDFIGVCYNAIVNYAAKTRYMSGGQLNVPMVLLTGTGGGYNNAAQHSQCLHATLAHMPGVKVVCPTNAYDAKGMMHQAIRDDDFVVYLMHKGAAGVGWMGPTVKTTLAEVPQNDYTVPFGKVKVYREGTDVTIVGVGLSVHHALEAAEELAKEGISAEVVDLRSLVPLDRDGIMESVSKTGRLIVADEDYMSYGVSGEVIASVVERDPTVLKAPPSRVCVPDVPIPYSRALENYVLPLTGRIADAARSFF